MKKLKLIVSAICSILIIQPNVFAGVLKEEKKVKKVIVNYFKALNESDVEKIVSLYHKDSTFFLNNAPASRGIEAIEQAYWEVFNTIKLDTTHTYQYVFVSGDMAVVESRAGGYITILKTNEQVLSTNNELFVLRKIDGEWKIDRYMFNNSKAP